MMGDHKDANTTKYVHMNSALLEVISLREKSYWTNFIMLFVFYDDEFVFFLCKCMRKSKWKIVLVCIYQAKKNALDLGQHEVSK